MEYFRAKQIANRLLYELGPYCKRMEIAGSLRRGKAEVGDIEIVAIPKMIAHLDLLGQKIEDINGIEYPLSRMMATDGLRQSATGAKIIKDGPRYKQIELPEGINLDLFLVLPPAQWGVNFAIRTGPKEFSQWIVTPRSKGGCLPSYCRVREGAIRDHPSDDHILEMPEEIDFLNLLGLGWIEPGQRAARWGRQRAT